MTSRHHFGTARKLASGRWQARYADMHRGTWTDSAGTRAKAYRLLRILADAVEAGYLPRNPCTIKGAGRERTPEMRHVNAEQLAVPADAIAPRYRALVPLAGYGRLRWGELGGVSWPDSAAALDQLASRRRSSRDTKRARRQPKQNAS